MFFSVKRLEEGRGLARKKVKEQMELMEAEFKEYEAKKKGDEDARARMIESVRARERSAIVTPGSRAGGQTPGQLGLGHQTPARTPKRFGL